MATNPHYWDETNESKMGQYVTKVELDFLQEVLKNCDKDSAILIVGCGSGKEAKFLTDLGFTNLTGTDPDKDYLEVAKKKVSHLKIKVDTAPNISFDDEAFDVVIGLEMLGYFSNKELFFAEVARVLKAEGICIFTVANKYSLKGLAYQLYKQINSQKMVSFAYTLCFWDVMTLLRESKLSYELGKGYNWNLLHRASNSPLLRLSIFLEKIGLSRLVPVSSWFIFSARKKDNE